jgi:hypothetical protein
MLTRRKKMPGPSMMDIVNARVFQVRDEVGGWDSKSSSAYVVIEMVDGRANPWMKCTSFNCEIVCSNSPSPHTSCTPHHITSHHLQAVDCGLGSAGGRPSGHLLRHSPPHVCENCEAAGDDICIHEKSPIHLAGHLRMLKLPLYAPRLPNI